jgi:hypothetical protein
MTKASDLARFGAVQSGQVIESISSPCDGSSITVRSGSYTTFTDLTGSSFTYTPPSIATRVVYEFNWHESYVDTYGVGHHKFLIDSDEVTNARFNCRGTFWGHPTRFRWIINIGGVADADDGRVASWTSNKTLKLQLREFGSGNEVKAHATEGYDGGATDVFSMPTLSITAIK